MLHQYWLAHDMWNQSLCIFPQCFCPLLFLYPLRLPRGAAPNGQLVAVASPNAMALTNSPRMPSSMRGPQTEPLPYGTRCPRTTIWTCAQIACLDATIGIHTTLWWYQQFSCDFKVSSLNFSLRNSIAATGMEPSLASAAACCKRVCFDKDDRLLQK